MKLHPGSDPTEAASRGTCNRCGQEMLWAETERGNWVPLDATPQPAGRGGTFALEDGTAYHVPHEYRPNAELFRFHGLQCGHTEEDRR